MSLFFRLLRRRNELPPAGDRAPSGPIPGCWPPRCSEAEVDIAGRVPAAALAALAHPSARQAELGSAESDARDVSAEADLIGAIVALPAHLRAEECARAGDIVAEPADGIVGVEGCRIRAQDEDERLRCGIDPEITLNLEAGLCALHRIGRVEWRHAVILVVDADRQRNGPVVEDVAPPEHGVGRDKLAAEPIRVALVAILPGQAEG